MFEPKRNLRRVQRKRKIVIPDGVCQWCGWGEERAMTLCASCYQYYSRNGEMPMPIHISRRIIRSLMGELE